ncbi:MAG TPA: exodeoxyribonuclease III [Bacteroidales bacterium]|nr:exodeoxyribonuclease III [Bacteroidales bacterium]
MTQIISYNVNGIRSAIDKGFIEWLHIQNPDILHIQEVKALKEQINTEIFKTLGYTLYWFAAQKKGYSGVATLTKNTPTHIEYGIGNNFFDNEGRFIRLDYPNYTLINSYFPSGSSGDLRQQKKEEYLELIFNYCKELIQKQPNIIISGDFNICHTPIDINHPERHTGYSGFLPQEREWMDKLMHLGFVDSFRIFNTQPHNYSWWSYRAGARSKNLGWRIDYHLVSTSLRNAITHASILPHIIHSDHCPVVIEIQL